MLRFEYHRYSTISMIPVHISIFKECLFMNILDFKKRLKKNVTKMCPKCNQCFQNVTNVSKMLAQKLHFGYIFVDFYCHI